MNDKVPASSVPAGSASLSGFRKQKLKKFEIGANSWHRGGLEHQERSLSSAR